jgi:hypothetical protein
MALSVEHPVPMVNGTKDPVADDYSSNSPLDTRGISLHGRDGLRAVPLFSLFE